MKPERRNLSLILGLVMLLASIFMMKYLVKLLIWLG